MKAITLKCKVITPLFIGGANQQAELRTQSFNGLFRYWFRLLGGSFEDEKKLFGWGGEKGNKGKVAVFIDMREKVDTKKFEKFFDDKGRVIPNRGINYIGFSLDQRFKKNDRKPQREYIEKQCNFNLTIKFYPALTNEDIKKYLSVVWCAFYLGNFGSRSRRGFGSVLIGEDVNLKDFISFKPVGNISIWIKTNLGKIKDSGFWKRRDGIPYIFEDLEIYKIKKSNFNNWQNWIKEVQKHRSGLIKSWGLNEIKEIDHLLDFMGFLMGAYRSYTEPDYDVAKGIIFGSNIRKGQIIERIAFGLPLNFYFSSIKKDGKVDAKLDKETLRRASPLIFKVLSDGNNFEGFFIRFKKGNWNFFPDGARLYLNNVELNMPRPLLKAIDDFLNNLASYKLVERIYP